MDTTFDIGDVVALKSGKGPPAMTVTSVDHAPKWIKCAWSIDGDIAECLFRFDELEKKPAK